MKSKFKFFGLLIAICLIICCVFAGCTSTDYEAVYNDDAKIASSTSNTREGSVESSKNGSFKFSCSSLSGVFVAINSFKIDENTSANLSFEVAGGKGKVVLVKGKSVYTVAEGSFDDELNLTDIPKGKYKLKIVGVEADINLTLTY